MRGDLARAIAVLKQRRQYASFFEWTEEDGKELGVGEEFVAALNTQCGFSLSDIELQRPDPPDLNCLNSEGVRVGIELAEVVCEEAVRRNAKGERVYRVWRPGELTVAISEVLIQKDTKTYHGGPFADVYVCLFSDEPALTIDAARAELNGAKFGPFSQITRSFLLFSYHPSTQTYPILALGHHA